MTKVQTTFKLSRELSDPELKKISQLHAVYGFFVARVLPSEELFIEYDAARLSANEVRGTIEQHGIPIS